MTAVSASTRARPDRSGLWTFLRLLGGWATVALLAYLLWTPSKDWGWPTLLFGWVLLTLLADEFAGWFGYMALALGVLPLLHGAATPEQWYIILPLIGGAMFALLILKHSGGPFVLPFGALLFAGTIIAAAKFGAKIDPTLKLPASATFQRMAMLPMLAMVGFSFLRQLTFMLVRWRARRKATAAAVAPAAPVGGSASVATPEPTPTSSAQGAQSAPLGTVVAAAVPQVVATPAARVDVDLTEKALGRPGAAPAVQNLTPQNLSPQNPVAEAPANPTLIDIDLADLPSEKPTKS